MPLLLPNKGNHLLEFIEIGYIIKLMRNMLIEWQLYALSGITIRRPQHAKMRWNFWSFSDAAAAAAVAANHRTSNKVENKLKLKLILNEFFALTCKNS